MANPMDPLQMLMHAADRIGNAAVEGLGWLVGTAVQHAPGAVGATVNAAADFGAGINNAVRDVAAAITPSVPAVSMPSFAGLNLGDAAQGLRGCGMGADMAELGQLSSPLAHLSQMRQTGYGMNV